MRAFITLLYGICVILIFYYYGVHFSHAVNFPIHDEYRTISTVNLDYLGASDWREKIRVLLVNENESLQLVLKLANIGFLSITGQVRYDFLGYIGQLSLLGFPMAVYLMNRRNDTAWLDIGLTVFVIFNLQYYVLSFRHDTSFYYHLGLVGVLFSVFHWVKGNYWWAFAFFLLAIFNNTSSVLLVPAYVANYLVTAHRIHRRYLIGGGVVFVILLGVFYAINPYLFYLPEGWKVTSKAFLIVMGNLVEFKFGHVSEKPFLVIGLLFLLFTLATFAYYAFVFKNKSQRSQFYALMAIYFFISILAIALKRSSLYHYLQNLLDPRYQMFTFPLLLFLLLLWHEMIRVRHALRWACLLFFLVYNILCAFRAQDMVRFYDQGIRLNSVSVPRGYDMLGPVHIDFAIPIYAKLKANGIAPQQDEHAQALYAYMDSVRVEGWPANWNAEVSVSRIFDSGRYHTVQKIVGEAPTRKSWLFLKSEENTFLFPIDFYYPRPFFDFLRHGDYCTMKFNSTMFLSVLEGGDYALGLVTQSEDGQYELLVHPQRTSIDAIALNMEDEYPQP